MKKYLTTLLCLFSCITLLAEANEDYAKKIAPLLDPAKLAKEWFEARPHPGPLPRGEGESQAALW